jgi:carboxyl-terminal processing protease
MRAQNDCQRRALARLEAGMEKKNAKFEFVALLTFLVAGVLLLTNGFSGRISAESKGVDVYQAVEPIGTVLGTVLDHYVRDVNLDRAVEGALMGMMTSLDRHTSFITKEELTAMREDTKGEFEGIGVSIKTDSENHIIVFKPILDSPAAKAGLRPFDIIIKIDDVSAEGMSLNDAADKIRGPRGTSVKITVKRKSDVGVEEIKEFTVKRAKVPLESIMEARLLDGGVGYARVSDFKETTARDLKKSIAEFLDKGMKGFILDLRWNPGGLLDASREVSELFLPKNSLVTYTKGRPGKDGKPNKEDMRLYTSGNPIMPPGVPIIVLVNGQTASAAEIVTGALQFHKRAIVIGQKTYGKGSVQTILPLEKPQMTALRLTTALYYTPADVTIDHQGILPDVEVEMTEDQEKALSLQMYQSYESDPTRLNLQNHGAITGNAITEKPKEATESEKKLGEEIGKAYGSEAKKMLEQFMTKLKATTGGAEDLPLKRADELLREDPVWDNLMQKYHKDTSETQKAADAKTVEGLSDADRELLLNNMMHKQRKGMDKPEAPTTTPEEPILQPAAPGK